MEDSDPTAFEAALGYLRHRVAIAVIGFGVYFGWLVASLILLTVLFSYSNTLQSMDVALRRAIFGSIFLLAAALTYRCRGIALRAAAREGPDKPLRMWKRDTVDQMGRDAARILFGLISFFVGAALLLALGYAGYFLITAVSTPIAILIGAIIIAFAIVVAASR
ncbi:hypothetical protein [Erythrobacter aureus]|nr:hypothetical protein [Erythrobacter aureus]